MVTVLMPATSAAIPNRITKSSRSGRGASVVRPILKKLVTPERKSLDLDRGWDEQTTDYVWRGGDDATFRSTAPAASASPAGDQYYYQHSLTRSARDVSFSTSVFDLSTTSAAIITGRSHNHARSTSVNSHLSIATSGSGITPANSRGGSFVHPFQQIPRNSTPPVSVSFPLCEGPGPSNNHSEFLLHASHTIALASSASPIILNHSHSLPYSAIITSGLRRPSLVSQRTDSLTDVTSPAATTGSVSAASGSNHAVPFAPSTLSSGESHATAISVPGARPRRCDSSHLALGIVTTSRSDLQPSTVSSSLESGGFSPLRATAPGLKSVAAATSSALSSPTGCSIPFSPVRRSLDATSFRMRSRTEVSDVVTRQEHVREARRRFEEKERVKAEKYAREQVRRRDRANSYETHHGGDRSQTDLLSRRATTPVHKNGGTSHLSHRMAASTSGASIRGGTGGLSRSRGSHETDDGRDAMGGEKIIFASQRYDQADEGQEPRADDVVFETQPRRRTTAKHKTTGTWTLFILWLRTKLLRLARR